MEIEEAIKVIRALADGVDPGTGKSLEESAICRQPESVKALNRALASLVAQSERERRRPTNAGKPWTRAEDEQVCEELRQGNDFQLIAKAHGRTVPSIVARLVKLGKVAPNKSGPIFPSRVA